MTVSISIIMMIATINRYTIDVTIGFDSTTYTVRESNGSVLLQINLLTGEFDNNVAISVRLNTVDGSAKCS